MSDNPLAAMIRDAVRAEIAPLLASGVAQKRVFTLAEASVYVGLTEEALRSKVNRNEVPVVRFDGRLRFDKKELDRWIEDNTRYED